MDDDLVCNYRKCRKRLTNYAWVTSCSHLFCDEDGSREFSRQATCPACETELPGQLDITKVDLHPSEQYKSMVLAGHRPETIMEICSRALSFWTYQSHQEKAYQEYCASKAMEKAQAQESHYQQTIAVHTTESSSLKTQVSALKRDLESTRTKFNEVSEKLMEKTRQYQKLQGMYDTMRRRNVIPAAVYEDVRYTPSRQPPPQRRGFEPYAPAGLHYDKEAYLPPRGAHQTHLQPSHPNKRHHLQAPVPLLGARRGGDQQSDQFTISSSSSATTARGQEVNYDPTIVSLINASSSNNIQSQSGI